MLQGGHSACQVEGIAPPIQVATCTWGFEDAQGNAACRDEVCKANIAVDEDRSGSSRRRLMDSVVAPYRPVLLLERLVGTNAECTLGKTLSAQRTG